MNYISIKRPFNVVSEEGKIGGSQSMKQLDNNLSDIETNSILPSKKTKINNL
jgi:hypothetical protein